jgi:hypothetical protein
MFVLYGMARGLDRSNITALFHELRKIMTIRAERN